MFMPNLNLRLPKQSFISKIKDEKQLDLMPGPGAYDPKNLTIVGKLEAKLAMIPPK